MTSILEPSIADEPSNVVAAPPANRHRLQWFGAISLWLLIAAIIYLAAVFGWQARRWTWDTTDPIRFIPDTRRQCYWALVTSGPEGFLNQFDKMAIQTRDWEPFLDYVPLRLLVMQRWGVYIRHHFPDLDFERPFDAYRRSYEFSAMLLRFNAAMDAIAAASAFLIVVVWVRKSAPAFVGQFAGVWRGLIAALLIWFNPAILLSAYSWPTWDSWIVPMYLLAALLASVECWFLSGIVLAVGAMLKGQQLAVASIFVIWPLMQGRLGAATRWCVGMIFGFALIASPWLLTSIPADRLAAARDVQHSNTVLQYPPTLFAMNRQINGGALSWVIAASVIMASLPLIHLDRLKIEKRLSILIRGCLLCVAMLWPFAIAANRKQWPLAVGIACLCVWATIRFTKQFDRRIFLSWRNHLYLLAAVIGGTLLLSMLLFNADHAWWDCGFGFGSSRWHWTASSLTDNLPGLLFERFGWSKDPDEVAFILPAVTGHWPQFLNSWQWWPTRSVGVSAKQLFNPIFFTMLVICAIGLSRMARRKDRRTLIALTTPWVVFFLLPVEIHGRYCLYPGAISAICIGESVGMALLGIFITLAATLQIYDAALQMGNRIGYQLVLSSRYPNRIAPSFVHKMFNAVHHTQPDLAWGLMLAGAVFVHVTFSPSKRKQCLIGRD